MSSPVKGANEGRVESEPTMLAELDPAVLARLLKLLGRSAALGEDLDPFAGPPASISVPSAGANGNTTASAPGSPSKKKASSAKKSSKGGKKKLSSSAANATRRSSRSRSRSRSRNIEDEEEGASDVDASGENAHHSSSTNVGTVGIEVGDEDLERLGRALDLARESAAAASCAIALLGADALPKQVSLIIHTPRRKPSLICHYLLQLYSEEIIISCMSTIKNQLSKIIYPFVEGLGDIHGLSQM